MKTVKAGEVKAGDFLVADDREYRVLVVRQIDQDLLFDLDKPRGNGKSYFYANYETVVTVR